MLQIGLKCSLGTRKWLPKVAKIHRNLGKPKLPSPPSISFMNKLGKGPADKKEAGKAWTELPDSEKQKYRDQYRLDLAEYRKKVLDWKAHMVAERPADVVNQEEYQKLVLKESDQPKKPPSPNVMFSLDYWAKHGKAPGSVAEIVKAPVEQWKLLPEKEKQKYSDRFKTEMLEYKMKLLDWKAGMIAKGRTDLVDPEEYKQLVLEMSGQPKPPPAAHLMFYRDYAAEHKRVAGRAADLMKVASVQWKNLPEEDKQKYYNRYSDEWYAYEKRLRDWEREMTTISLEDDEDE
uniref:HMG box domain-containing protein n=1 Tax=Plectus sambesii TaxID=2011161 RepID=A0A914XA16_9BILA